MQGKGRIEIVLLFPLIINDSNQTWKIDENKIEIRNNAKEK